MKKTIITLFILALLVLLAFSIVKAKEGQTQQNAEDINNGIATTLATEETYYEAVEASAVSTLSTEPLESIRVVPENSVPTEEPITVSTEPIVDTQPSEPPTQPTEPTPTMPKPPEPKPTEPKPIETLPTEPQITEPKPTEPAPTKPEPTEPETTVPETTEPVQSQKPEYNTDPGNADLNDSRNDDYGDCPKCGRHLWTYWDQTGCFTFLVDSTCSCGAFVKAGQCHHH